jgi:hypothetical protein
MIIEYLALIISILSLSGVGIITRDLKRYKKEFNDKHDGLFNTLWEKSKTLETKVDNNFGIVLDASIDASIKVSNRISDKGDANLKEYIDNCLKDLYE